MPVEFLSVEQRHRYGKFVVPPTSAQLAQYFYLDDLTNWFAAVGVLTIKWALRSNWER